MSTSYKQVRGEYAHWRALDRRTKIALKLPLTDVDFAEAKGISDRTLRTWKKDPEFQQLVEQLKAEFARQAPNSTIAAEMVGGPRPVTHGRSKAKADPPRGATPADDPANDPSLPEDERQYRAVKDNLAKMAKEGDKGALDLYMKYWGAPFVEAEKANEADLFAEMSDAELAEEVCRLLGPDLVADWLAGSAAS